MAKLTAFIALFAMALLIANTYAYRTTVTTVEIVDENQGSKEKCREMGGGGYQQLRSCEQFLMQRGMSSRVLILNESQKEKMNECCRELREVDEECRCDKLEEIVRQQQHQEEGMKQQIKEKAKNLPAMCSLPPRRCDFY